MSNIKKMIEQLINTPVQLGLNPDGVGDVSSDVPYDPTSRYEDFIFPHLNTGKGSLVEKLPDCDLDLNTLQYFKEETVRISGPHHGGAKTIVKILDEMIDIRMEKQRTK